MENKPHMVSETIKIMNINDQEKFQNNQNNIMVLNRHTSLFYCLKSKIEKMNFKNYYYDIKEDNYIILLYELENIGLGHATNLKLDFNQNDVHIYPFIQKYLKKEEKIIIYIYINKELIDSKGFNLIISIQYNDITKLSP